MLFVWLLVYGAAELAAFVVVVEHIGFLYAFGLLIVVSALGPFLVRRVGLSVLAHTRERLDRGEAPTGELLDGLVVLIGGVAVCIPGFIGDAVGLLLMVAPVRRLVIRLAGRHLARRVRAATGGRWLVVDARTRPAPRPGRAVGRSRGDASAGGGVAGDLGAGPGPAGDGPGRGAAGADPGRGAAGDGPGRGPGPAGDDGPDQRGATPW